MVQSARKPVVYSGPDLEGAEEIAALCGVHVNTALRWIKRGMPVVRWGSRYRAFSDEVLAWVARRQGKTSALPVTRPTAAPADALRSR